MRIPLPVVELDESERSGGDVAGDQRGRGDGGHRNAAADFDPASVFVGDGFRADDQRRLGVFQHRKDGIGVLEVDDAQRIGIGNVEPRWPLGDQPGRPNLMVVVAQEAHVHVEVGDELGKHALADFGRVPGVDGHQLGGGVGDDTI